MLHEVEVSTLDFRNRDLREKVASLLGVTTDDYTQGRMTYDLRRLRLKGMIARIPGTNRYTVTTFGLKAALFYTKVQLRLLRPGLAMMTDLDENTPRPLRRALRLIDSEINKMCEQIALRPTG